MGVIVAAPTAGSAGVIPGSLIAVAEAIGASDDDVCRALWNASAIGAIVARNASVAGAEGGCQAEVGTATAMAASAICELLGADPARCLSAASTAISNLLGLVCDPVRGLVEHPCQTRNAIGVAGRVLPVLNPKLYDEVGTVTDEHSGLTLQFRRGGAWETDRAVMTCEALFGAKLLQPTKIVRIVSEAYVGPTGPSGATGDVGPSGASGETEESGPTA
jgi:hypothetical protein